MEKISLLSPEAVRNHLANSSPSKFAHAFPKQKRFSEPNPEYSPSNADVKWPFTLIAAVNFQNEKLSLAEANVLTLLSASQSHLLPRHTIHRRTLVASIGPSPLESVETNLLNALIFIDL